jgi:glucose/arabinose dehydrogenase
MVNYALGFENGVQFLPQIIDSMPTVNDSKLRVETVAKGLNFPSNLAFLGPGDILVTEKNNGTVKRIINGIVQHDPLLDVNVATRAERGMLGIVVSDNNDSVKDTNNFRNVYVYFTASAKPYDTNGTSRGERSAGNHLLKYELVDSKLTNGVELLNLSKHRGFAHNGGALIIGPDKNLYVPVGDADGSLNSTNFPEHNTEAQNVIGGGPPDGTGGILTITPNGRTYANILGNSNDVNKYYAYGIRNSFGLDFDPLTGKLWDTENGEDNGDEINILEPGFNSGWKKVQGKAPNDFNYSQLVNFGGKGRYSDPEFSWVQTVGPTKIKFLNSDKLGYEYKNDIFVSDIKYGRIYHFDLNDKRDALFLPGKLQDKVADSDQETSESIFGSGFGGITDMDVGPDGLLYILSFGNGAIYRISPR